MMAEAPANSFPQQRSRSWERYRLARLAVVLGGVESAVTGLVSALRIALLVWGLDLREYGLYMAILGLVATANLLDFGLHFGVTNVVSAARGREDEASIRRTIATAFLTYSTISLAAICVLLPTLRLVPVAWILNIAPAEASLARRVALVGFAGLLLVMPFKVFGAALTGFQEQYVVSMGKSLASVAQLAILGVAIIGFKGHLMTVVAAGFVADISSWSLFGLWVTRRRPGLAIHVRAASRKAAPGLIGIGTTFFVINLANMLKSTFGSTILSHRQGPSAVPTFSVPLSLFTIALGLSWMVSASFWPAYGEAAARGDWPWVQRAFVLGTKAAVGVAGWLATLGGLFGDEVIRVWAPKAGIPSRALLVALAAWLVAQACIGACTSLLNGLNQSRIVMWINLLEGILAFVTSVALVGRFGGEGISAAMASGGIVSSTLLLVYAVPRWTGGQVRAPFGPLGRVAGSALGALVCGTMATRALDGAGPIASLLVGAGLTTLVYAALAWVLVLGADERERVLAWARATWSSAKPRR